MLDLKWVRDNPAAVRDAAERKRIAVDVDAFLGIDEKLRQVQQVVESMRADLKVASKKIGKLSPEERQAALQALAKLPRNSSPVRLRTRCIVSGRPRAVYKKFMLSRIAFRELAHAGQLPGVHKASW